MLFLFTFETRFDNLGLYKNDSRYGFNCLDINKPINLSDNVKLRCSHTTPCVIWSTLILVLLMDTAINSIFVYAAHTKQSRLMASCLYYNIFLFVVSNIVFFLVLGYIVVIIDSISSPIELIILCLITGFGNAVLQFYIILLIRSQVRRLKNNSSVIFENDEDNAKCFIGNIDYPYDDAARSTTT